MASRDPAPILVCSYPLWWGLFRQLRRRGAGIRESGAFLLGERRAGTARVRTAVYYDDIDPAALSTGIVRLSGHAMGAVWEICAREALEVVADIHTHPGGAGQSQSDKDHPMVSMRGHVALIAPRFARNTFKFSQVGAYRYRGSKAWDDLPTPRPSWAGVMIRGA